MSLYLYIFKVPYCYMKIPAVLILLLRDMRYIYIYIGLLFETPNLYN